jgi:hypothetical protein
MFYYDIPHSFTYPVFVISDSELKLQKKRHLEARKDSLQNSMDFLQDKMSKVVKSLEELDEQK